MLLSHLDFHCTLPFKISYFFAYFAFSRTRWEPVILISIGFHPGKAAARAGARDIWKISKEKIDGLSPCVPPPSPSWSDKYLDGWEKPICERKRQKLLTEQKQNGGEKSFWNFPGSCGHAACRERTFCKNWYRQTFDVWILLSRFCLSFVHRFSW